MFCCNVGSLSKVHLLCKPFSFYSSIYLSLSFPSFFLKFFTIFFYLVIDHMHGMLHLPFFLGLVFIYQLLFSSFFALLSQGTVEMMLFYWPFWNYMFQWQFVLLHSALHLCSATVYICFISGFERELQLSIAFWWLFGIP